MQSFTNLLKDPPPAYAFELSEAGIAYSNTVGEPQIQFQPFDPGVLSISPVHDNVQQREFFAQVVDSLVPANGNRKRRAAIILPDYCARVAVLDFDSFPSGNEEQRALVRFRMKKSVPFDVETAAVSYYAQQRAADDKHIEVVVAILAPEIVASYEAPFRDAGYVPGYVTTSALAMMSLLEPDGIALIVKVSGRTLTAVVLDGVKLKLVRCVEMADADRDEIESVIHPTMAYIEDELKKTPQRILLSGMGQAGEELLHEWRSGFGVSVETLRSRYGMPGPSNAGLLGYLESLATG